MSMPRAIRHINEARLIAALLRKGPQSRADLARALGLTRSTAGNLIGGLEDIGLVTAQTSDTDEDRADTVRDVGRPGALFALCGDHSYFLGMELGVGYLRAVLMDLTGQIVARRYEPWDSATSPSGAADPEWLAGRIAVMVDQILSMAAPGGGVAQRLRGVCISVPGLVAADGTILRAPNLGWSNIPFLALLRAHLPDMPVISIENDANAFALSQMEDLRGRGIRDACFLWIEAGVGGAIMCNGTLIRGAHGYAGEFGHLLTVATDDLIVPAEGPARMEDVVGLDGVLAASRKTRTGTGSVRLMSVDSFLAALARRDADAMARLTLWSRALASTLASLSSALDPKAIYLGGPGALLFPVAREQVTRLMADMQLAGSPMPDIVVSDLGQDAPCLGCAMMLHEQYLAIDEKLVFGTFGRVG